MDKDQHTEFGIVAIGRNEGERLKRCLRSLPATARVIYVDSGSTDGSEIWARDFAAEVVHLDLSTRFTAARARNAGFPRLLEFAPQISWMQSINADCALVSEPPVSALAFLQHHADVAHVS